MVPYLRCTHDQVLFGDDEHQSSPAIDHSENEVVHELQQAHQLAQVVRRVCFSLVQLD